MTTKMTERDKKLLAFLANIVVIAAFAVLVFFPQIENAQSLDAAIYEQEALKMELEAAAMQISEAEIVYEEAVTGWEAASDYFYDKMSRSEIDKLVTEIISGYTLNIRNVGFDIPQEAGIIELYGGAADVSDDDAEPVKVIYTAKISLVLGGDYNEILEFIDEIYKNYPAIGISSISHSTEKEKVSDELTVSTTVTSLKLNIYMCDKEI